MNTNQIFGLVLAVVGVVLLAFGINSTQAVHEEVLEAVSGRYTEHTMMYILGGVALIAGGIALLIKGRSIV